MRVFKKFALCLFATAISSYAYADIIELDAFNPDHCRQQILKSTDDLPVIAAYTSGNSDSESFMKKFELLAKEHPERTFFKWDAKQDVQHVTQTLCLQQLGFSIQPNIILLGVVKDAGERIERLMTSPLRLAWAGEMTKAEMNKFIDVSDSGMKKAFLSQEKSH